MRNLILIVFFFNLVLFCIAADNYPIRLQPELDSINVEGYLRNPRLLRLQINCILKDGPCDVVGRWIKPRVKDALLGQCVLCTEKQKGWLDRYLNLLVDDYPELYRAAIARYVQGLGVQINDEEIEKARKTFLNTDLSKIGEKRNNHTNQQDEEERRDNGGNSNSISNIGSTIKPAN